jgi:SAM-dependent methyltransferase
MKIRKISKKKVSLCLTLFPLLLMLGTASGQYQNSLDVPFVPTPEEVVETMLAMAEISPNDVLYDLGCGDGRIVITAAKKYNCRGVGIDLDPVRIRESQFNAQEAGVEDRVEFLHKDLFEADFSQATVVTLYLLTEVNRKLRPRLLRELNPGTRVVSHDFDMGEWAADKETIIEGDWDVHAIYFWKIPANVSGTWKWSLPDEMGKTRITLKLDQMFQDLKGKFTQGTLRFATVIEKGTIDGTKLSLVLERRPGGLSERLLFEGTAQGHTIQGTVQKEGSTAIYEWRAKRNPATMNSIDGESARSFIR